MLYHLIPNLSQKLAKEKKRMFIGLTVHGLVVESENQLIGRILLLVLLLLASSTSASWIEPFPFALLCPV